MEQNILLDSTESITSEELISTPTIQKNIVENNILLSDIDSNTFIIKPIIKSDVINTNLLLNEQTLNTITLNPVESHKNIIQSSILINNLETTISSIIPIKDVDNVPVKENILLNQIEIPVHDNLITTSRPLNTDSINNDDLISGYENTFIPSVNLTDGNYFPSDPEQLPRITSLEELLKYLSEIMIRFSTSPDYYQQDDFAIFIKTITNALIDLYLRTPVSDGELQSLLNLLYTKVDKIEGKELSTNDLTNELKELYDLAYSQTHTHDNKYALDLVEGSNKGDQDLSNLVTKDELPVIPSLDGYATELFVTNITDTKEDKGVAQILITDLHLGEIITHNSNEFALILTEDENYVTDIEKVNLHNPHSDDQDLSGLVVKVEGKSLILNTEIERLTTLHNVDISGKVDKVEGKSLILDSEITRLTSVYNVDITGKVDKVDGKSLVLDTEIAKIHSLHADDQDLTPYQLLSEKGINNGYTPLDSGGKVALQYLPSTLLKYIGTWDIINNDPILISPDLTKVSNVYTIVGTGTRFGINFKPGDWLIYNSDGIPEKSDNSDDVTMVNGQTGIVTITKSDVGLSLVDNTTDLNKPISNDTQLALNLKVDKVIGSRLITTAESVILGNTSNINTGDQTLTSLGAQAELSGHGYVRFIGKLAIYDESLFSNTIGNYNTALGYQSLYANTIGSGNLAIGYQAMFKNIDGGTNLAFGNLSLFNNLSGTNNFAIGNNTLYANTIGTDNFALGNYALYNNTDGISNIAIGTSALGVSTSTIGNTAIGTNSMSNATFGSHNTAIGAMSLIANTTGTSNVSIGYQSLYTNTEGSYNVGIGDTVLNNNVLGGYNIALGDMAASYCDNGVNLLTNIDHSIFIGGLTEALHNNSTNEIVIGYTAKGSGSNTITLGNNDVLKTMLRGDIYVNGVLLSTLYSSIANAFPGFGTTHVLSAYGDHLHTGVYQPVGNYLTSFTETDPVFTAWDKSTGITITKSQITDFPTIPSSQVQTDWNATSGIGVLLNKPTQLSQFTNNLGNYGNWITGISSGMVTTALGYTPYNSTNPSGYINSLLGAVLTDQSTQQIIGSSASRLGKLWGSDVDVSGNIKINASAPFINMYSTLWSTSTFIQTGVNVGATDGGDYFNIYNPAGKGFSYTRGGVVDLSISPSGIVNFLNTPTIAGVSLDSKYIQNNPSSVQSGSVWVDGRIIGNRIDNYDPTLTAGDDIAYSIGKQFGSGTSGFLGWRNNSGVPYMYIETYGGVTPISIFGSNFNVNALGAAVFTSTVTATQFNANNFIVAASYLGDSKLYLGGIPDISWGYTIDTLSSGLNFKSTNGASKSIKFDDSGNINTDGTVTATQFNGSGAGLTGTASSLSVNYANSAGSISNFTVRIDRSDSNVYNLAGRGTGIYAISDYGGDGPGAMYLNLLHMTNGGDVAFQIAGGYTSDNMYFRGTSNLAGGDSYTPWRTVIHSGNIGSQSVNNASYSNNVIMHANRTDGAFYQVLWGTDSNVSSMYSCAGVQIQSSTGTIKATAFSTGYIQIVEKQINEPATNATSAIAYNYTGYAGGTTQFRNFDVFNGKMEHIVTFRGEDLATIYYGPGYFNQGDDSTGGSSGALQVSGGIYASGKCWIDSTLHVDADTFIAGIITATNFIMPSDIKLKTNITPITKDYSNIQFKEYEFKNKLGEKRYGVIAQELLESGNDEFVSGNEEIGYSVKYIDLLIAKISNLETRIKQLENN